MTRAFTYGIWVIAVLTCIVPAGAAEKGVWTPISDSVTSQVKPGYPGKTAGVTVDPTNGELFMVVPDQGIWKSTDHGSTFARVDEKAIGGRCETGFALDFDPAGKRLMCFMIYGSSALTRDDGRTWLASKTSHLDFGAVDWFDTGKCFVALRHESGGVLTYSSDEGQTWQDLGKDFAALGIFSPQVLIANRGKGQGLLRSTDAGKSWNKVSEITPAGMVMRTLKNAGYWATDAGLLVSRDQGQSWKIEGAAVPAMFGPYWSNNPKHFVVVGKGGFHETLDAGQSWKVVAPLPPEFTVHLVGPNYAWDPVGNIFYASSMGKDTLKFER